MGDGQEYIISINDEFTDLKKTYIQKKNNLVNAKMKYIEYIQSVNEQESEYINTIVINKDSGKGVTLYNPSDMTLLEEVKNYLSNNTDEKSKIYAMTVIAVYYTISNNDWGDAENIVPIKEWYDENYDKTYNLPHPNNEQKTFKTEDDEDYKLSEGPYYSEDCIDDETQKGICSLKKAKEKCAEYGAHICSKWQINSTAKKKNFNDIFNNYDKDGWLHTKKNTYVIGNITNKQKKGANVAIAAALALAQNDKSKMDSISETALDLVNNPSLNITKKDADPESDTSGVFCCKKKKCENEATQKGIWVRDGDNFNQTEFKDYPKCNNLNFIVPDFFSDDLFRNADSYTKRQPELWDVIDNKYYTEMYFVNRFGYKHKINTDNIVKNIEDSDKNEEIFNKNMKEFDKIGGKYVNFPKVYLSKDEIDEIKSGIDISGDSIGVENVGNNIRFDNQIAWVDVEGNKNIYASDNIFKNRNKISCPTKIVDVTGTTWESIPVKNTISSKEYNCQYIDNTLYKNVMEAYDDLKKYVDDVENHMKKITEVDTEVRNKLINIQKIIRKDMTQINNDINETDRLKMLKDSSKGRLQESKLTKDSNKLQLQVWLFISLLLLIFALNNIRGEMVVSKFNIFMLFVCVIILFIIARKLYVSKII